MDGDTLVRDLLELLIVVAVGGILVTSVRRLRAGRLRVHRCPACGRPFSRVYAECPHCRQQGARPPSRPSGM